jgi:hypothetical protein
MDTALNRNKLIDLETMSPATSEKSSSPSEDPQRHHTKEIPAPKIVDTKSAKADSAKRVALTRSFLVNKLNFINFSDRTITLRFKHHRFDRTFSIKIKPPPCQGERLDLQWPPNERLICKLKPYRFDAVLISDGQTMIRAEAEVISLNQNGIRLRLPESCERIGKRKLRRHPGRNVGVRVAQNTSFFSGRLLDFNATTLRVELAADAHQSFEWINSETAVNIILAEGADTYFAGECRIIRHSARNAAKQYVLEPICQGIHRYSHREFRSERLEINPSPDIHFTHPLTKKRLCLKVVDISGSGFSIEEDAIDAQLMTGLIIPEVEVRFSNSVSVKCKAQVVYRKNCEEHRRNVWVKCGMAILDMDMENNVKLLSLLHQANNRYAYICNRVDLDALWEFFFESGFIYPGKYAYIEANKDRLKGIYEKLYTQSPGIARHFIYQEKGRILGHMAMVRFYENTWLIQHHAARKSALNKAGLVVLKQIGHFINDSYRLSAIHLKYVMMYYRPNNRFPSRVFGGAHQQIDNPKACSIDPFAYLHLPVTPGPAEKLPHPWSLNQAQAEDLVDLKDWYECDSGGLMLEALDLDPDRIRPSVLDEEYRRLGFKKEKYLYALKAEGLLKAIILVNITDFGFNMSNLTNCIKFIAVDAEGVTGDIFRKAVYGVYDKHPLDEMTVMVTPVSFADAIQLSYDKIYNMWVMKTRDSDPYFRYLNRLLKHVC